MKKQTLRHWLRISHCIVIQMMKIQQPNGRRTGSIYIQNVENVFRLNLHRSGTKTKSHHGNYSETLAVVKLKANAMLRLTCQKKEKTELEKQFCLVGLSTRFKGSTVFTSCFHIVPYIYCIQYTLPKTSLNSVDYLNLAVGNLQLFWCGVYHWEHCAESKKRQSSGVVGIWCQQQQRPRNCCILMRQCKCARHKPLVP